MDFARSAKCILCVAIAFAGFLLGSCTEEAPEELALAAATVEKEERSYGVSFLANGEEISSQTVREGEFPGVPEVEDIEGARFGGWVDSNGRRAEPGATPVEAECSYEAVFLPLLDGSGPYLFTGSGGLLRPDAVLDSTELMTALNALSSDSAKAHFPETFKADDSITTDELRAVLAGFFTYDEMDRVILGFEDVDKLSRAQFAVIMNALLGRETDEKVIAAASAYRIPDVPLTRSDYTQLMEAAIEHSHSETGSQWRNIALPAIYEEGYVLVEGGLYMVDSEGFFVTDNVVGTLTFGYDGRYTSGDMGLDSYVRAVIADIAEAMPEASTADMLKAAYDYCCGNFEFSRRNIYEVGAQGWALSEAVTMFEAGNGNGCSYAAAFWALARGLGYEAVPVSGAIAADKTPHAWVEIEIDGENYIFDPAMEAGALEGVEAGRDMFMKPESQSAMYGYFKG